MRETNPIPNENPEIWDAGTYQTGASNRSKKVSGIAAVMLTGVILLCGLTSAMGIANIRLLPHLTEQKNSVITLSVDPNDAQAQPIDSLLTSRQEQLPSLPEVSFWELPLQMPPKSQVAHQLSARQVYEKNKKSLVHIYSQTPVGTQPVGVGVILSSEGYILTNAHGIVDANRIFVGLPDGQQLRAVPVGSDYFSDLAVLYVEAENLTAAEFVDSQALCMGETVYAFSGAGQERPVMTDGVVHALSRPYIMGKLPLPLIRTDAKSNFGPVFNAYGQIVGIHVGKIARHFDDNLTQGQGFTLPSAELKSLLSQLICRGSVANRPTLGIETEEISGLYQQYWSLPGGLQITEVLEGSHAQRQGLLQGDILLALDGYRLTEQADLYDRLLYSEAGDILVAVVFRSGRQLTMELQVEKQS